MCPHTVRMLQYMCSLATIYVSSYYSVLMLLCMCLHAVLMLLYMSHALVCVLQASARSSMHTSAYVSIRMRGMRSSGVCTQQSYTHALVYFSLSLALALALALSLSLLRCKDSDPTRTVQKWPFIHSVGCKPPFMYIYIYIYIYISVSGQHEDTYIAAWGQMCFMLSWCCYIYI